MISWAAWIAAALELSGIWAIGNRNRNGFVLLLTANFLWICVALGTEPRVYGLLAVVMVAGVLNVRNWIKWRRKKRVKKASIQDVRHSMFSLALEYMKNAR